MKTSILTAMLVLTAASGIVVASQSAAAGGKPRVVPSGTAGR